MHTINQFREDIQFAFRGFSKKPSVYLLIVGTLALGIGANAAIFSMVYNTLLAPLPFSEGERLIKLKTNYPNINRYDVRVSVPTALDYIHQNETLSHVVEYHQMPFTLLGHGDAANVEAGVVGWDFFEMLKVRPILGRTFLPGEDQPGSKPLIVLSHHYWREQFDGNPDVIGMNLEMNNAVHQVIGVLPPLPAYPFKNDIWISSASCPGRGSDMFIGKRAEPISHLYAKLKPGITLAQANLDINTVSARLQAEYPDIYPASKGLTNTLTPLRDDMNGSAGKIFFLLLGITTLVLLIACANVASLNLARATARRQELAIREALGATPARIAQQVLTESIILSLCGAALGLFLAFFCIDLLSSFAALYTPLASEIEINGHVLLFCVLVALLTGIISGATAAFQKRNINEALKEGGGNVTANRTNNRLRQTLLLTQFSLSFIILTSASLISLSLYRLSQQDIGFDTTEVLAVDLSSSAENRASFVREVVHRLENIAGIDSVAYASEIPFVRVWDTRTFFQIEDQPPVSMDERPDALKNEVSANYHETLHIPLLQGRYLNRSDDENNKGSILINKSFADQFFAEETPIDKRISLDGGKTWLTIRGVVGDIRENGIDIPPVPTFYQPWVETWRYELRLFVRSKMPLPMLTPTIVDIIHQVNPRQAVADIITLQFIKDDSFSSSQLIGLLITLFALVSFFITLSGVVGVIAYNISQRKKEIGIRMALGGAPDRIRALFIWQGLLLSLLGISIGAVLMAFISPMLAAVLFETNPLDMRVYFVTALLIISTVTIAAMLPSRQAASVQPCEVLRSQ